MYFLAVSNQGFDDFILISSPPLLPTEGLTAAEIRG